MPKLENLRQLILESDEKIVAELAKRQELVRQIGAYKARYGLPVFDREREAKLKQYYAELSQKYGLADSFTQEVFGMIIQESRKTQQDNE
jgi:chorismate mutase